MSEINCNESIQVIVYILSGHPKIVMLVKHLFLSLCKLANLFCRFLTVDKLGTRLA